MVSFETLNSIDVMELLNLANNIKVNNPDHNDQEHFIHQIIERISELEKIVSAPRGRGRKSKAVADAELFLSYVEDFEGRIEKGEIPRSSQPPIGEVIDAYEQYSDYEIINIAMADGLSGTYQSAYGAKEMVENSDKITVINSKTLCGPHRYLVETAQKMADKDPIPIGLKQEITHRSCSI